MLATRAADPLDPCSLPVGSIGLALVRVTIVIVEAISGYRALAALRSVQHTRWLSPNSPTCPGDSSPRKSPMICEPV